MAEHYEVKHSYFHHIHLPKHLYVHRCKCGGHWPCDRQEQPEDTAGGSDDYTLTKTQLSPLQEWENSFMAQRPDWDEYFLSIARVVATRSDCTRRKIGAVIVRNNRIAATGYNGAPSGTLGCFDLPCPRSQQSYNDVPADSSYDTGPGSCIAIHAEANALLYASRDNCEGATIYISDEPCDGCLKLIKGAGIAIVITPTSEFRF